MRHPIGVIPFLLVASALPAMAASAFYTIDFTLTAGSPLPDSGSFDYDSTTSTFTSFEVIWDDDTFDLTADANAAEFTATTDPCYSGATTGAQEVFLLLTTCSTDANSNYYTAPPEWIADNNINPNGYTAFEFTTVPTVGPFSFNHVLFQYSNGTGTPVADTSGGFQAVAPEPGSCALTLIGFCLVMRKRIATGFSRLHWE
jgi:hypothetical protein